jgi:mono/diheme cytochrome c family protein
MKKTTVLKLILVMAALALPLLAPPCARPSALGGASTPTEIFNSKCALCHAKNGAGLPNWRAKGQPDFTNADWQKSHSDTQIAETIRNGKGKFMPSFKARLSEQDIQGIVSVVRGFGKK